MRSSNVDSETSGFSSNIIDEDSRKSALFIVYIMISLLQNELKLWNNNQACIDKYFSKGGNSAAWIIDLDYKASSKAKSWI